MGESDTISEPATPLYAAAHTRDAPRLPSLHRSVSLLRLLVHETPVSGFTRSEIAVFRAVRWQITIPNSVKIYIESQSTPITRKNLNDDVLLVPEIS